MKRRGEKGEKKKAGRVKERMKGGGEGVGEGGEKVNRKGKGVKRRGEKRREKKGGKG